MPLAAATGVTFYNASANGRDASDLLTNYAAEVYPHSPYLTGIPAAAIVLIGTNEFPFRDGAAAYARKMVVLRKLRADGFYVIDSTVPGSNFQPPGTTWDNRRLAYNVLTVANSEGAADYIEDISALVASPADTAELGDGTHPTITENLQWAADILANLKAHFMWP